MFLQNTDCFTKSNMATENLRSVNRIPSFLIVCQGVFCPDWEKNHRLGQHSEPRTETSDALRRSSHRTPGCVLLQLRCGTFAASCREYGSFPGGSSWWCGTWNWQLSFQLRLLNNQLLAACCCRRAHGKRQKYSAWKLLCLQILFFRTLKACARMFCLFVCFILEGTK